MNPALADAGTASPRPWRQSAVRLLWSVLLPGACAALIVGYLLPSQFESSSSGFAAVLLRVSEEHALLLFLTAAMVMSVVVQYWREQVTGAPPVPASPSAAGRRVVLRTGLALGAAALAALGLRAEMAEVYQVVSPSMVPTLEVGDRVLVDKHAYGWQIPFSTSRWHARMPARGDVIVFKRPSTMKPDGAGTDAVVKRVIGLPGDFVQFAQGNPIVNNDMIPNCDAGPFATSVGMLTIKGRLSVEFLNGSAYLTVRTPGGENFPGYRVMPGEVFVIGDDRGISSDSRVWNEGHGAGLPVEAIRGRVSRILTGGRRDGQIDAATLLKPLLPRVREAGLDLAQTQDRIAACLKHAPGN